MHFSEFMDKASAVLNLDLNSYKSSRVQRRVDGLMRRYNITGYERCYQRLKQDDDFKKAFINHFTINTSEFFRNPDTFILLKTKILPQLLANNERIKIWSAACSIGAEPYSIAIYLDEMKVNPAKYRIIGTDLDPEILQQARKGHYKENNLKQVPRDTLTRYFQKHGDKYALSPSILERVEFHEQDLLSARFSPGWDLIVCRNFMIYLGNEVKDKLIKKFVAALKPGGVLFVGNAEFIFKPIAFGLEKIQTSFYKKL